MTAPANEGGLQVAMEHCVHGLSQPLTTLLCRLELARLDPACGCEVRLLVEGCLVDFAKAQRVMQQMRTLLDESAGVTQ